MISSITNKTSGTAGTGTAGQEISFTFPVFASSEVVVIARNNTTGADTTLTVTTDYTVSLTGTGSPNYTGGSITMVVATYTSSYTIYIYRLTTQSQITDLVENDNLPANTLESRLDKLFCQIADLNEIVGRCIKVPLGDGTITTETDDKVNRASKYLKFDTNGHVVVSST
jgi:hypothetical protein